MQVTDPQQPLPSLRQGVVSPWRMFDAPESTERGEPAAASAAAPTLANAGAAAICLAAPTERDVFHLARRIALQVDLAATMRVLYQGLSRLTGSHDAMCIFDPALPSAWAGSDGKTPPTLDDDLRQLAAEVAGTGRRAVLEHAIVEPVGTAPIRAVFVVRRPSTSAAYRELEVATLAAIATAVVGLVGHFVAEHGARREQELRDARSPFRRDALVARRGEAAAPGRLVTTSRTWMRWAYPTLIGLVLVVVAAAALIEAPTYSTGVSIITVEGAQVTSPSPGTVAEVLVAPGTRVASGTPVLRLRALDEDAELGATETDYRNALSTFLATPGDNGARVGLAEVATRRQRAKAMVDARTLRAPAAGIVGDIRVRPGELVTPGAQVMKISPTPNLSVIALLPGFDRPRLEVGMTLQIDLPGYHKKREEAVIEAIGSQVIGPEEARKSLGAQIGDALPITGSVVLVHAQLSTRTFEAGGREYELHDGMVGKAEVKVDHESLLSLLFRRKRE